jgi:Alkylmercury lyase
MTMDQSRPTPVIPDWTVVTTPTARRALEGILAAGHYDSRFGGIDPDAARVLAQVLRLYARLGGAPAPNDLAADLALPTPSVKQQLAYLRARDLVLLDPTGETILGAYPFTQAATGHSVTFDGTGRTLATMCAIDALGAGAMCRDDVTIRSACRMCGDQVIASTTHRGMTLRQIAPSGAVVWVGLRESAGCAADTLCTELLFFCSDEHLARWRKDHGSGHRLSPEEAFQVGKALFIDRAMMGRA